MKRNSFDFLRAFAAICIVLLHATSYAYITMQNIDFTGINLIREIVTFFPGVVIFFALCGYLTCVSIDRSEDIKIFLKKRIARIYPELWGSMLFTLISISVILNGISWIEPSVGIWVMLQGIGISYTPGCLKDFATGSINGALWTLMVQIQFYILLVFTFRFVKKISLRKWVFIVLPILAIINMGARFLADSSALINKILERLVIPYLLWFGIGVFIYLFADQIKKKTGIVLGAVAIYVLVYALAWHEIKIFEIIWNYGYYTGTVRAIMCCVIVLLVGLGYPNVLPQKRLKYDISYEMFLTHWNILNALVYFDFYNRFGWQITFTILVVGSAIMAVLLKFIIGLVRTKIFNKKVAD